MTIRNRSSKKQVIQISDVYAMRWAARNCGEHPVLAIGNAQSVTVATIQSRSVRTVRFQPKFPRSCVSISWNQVKESVIAAGFKRAKDYCLQIWDVNRASGSTSQYVPISPGTGDRIARTTSNLTIHPIQKLCNAEECVSTEWFDSNPMCLAAGLENGKIRVYDTQVRSRANVIREFRAHESNSVVRAVASRKHMLATFSDDGTIKIWDMRKVLEKKGKGVECVSSMSYSSTISQISWLGDELLGTITLEDPWIDIWDVKSIESKTKCTAPTFRRYTGRPLACLDIVKKKTNRIRVVDWSLRSESIALTKCSSLDVKQDHLVMFNTEIASMTSLEDESTKRMKHLAKSKYGVDSKHNATLLKDRPSLQRVWTWISRLGKIPVSQSGVREIWSAQDVKSTVQRWMAFDVYTSPQRTIIHRLFGWVSSSDSLKKLMNEIETQHEDYGRSAALALFHGELELAVSALQRGIASSSSSSYRLLNEEDFPRLSYRSSSESPRSKRCDGDRRSSLRSLSSL